MRVGVVEAFEEVGEADEDVAGFGHVAEGLPQFGGGLHLGELVEPVADGASGGGPSPGALGFCFGGGGGVVEEGGAPGWGAAVGAQDGVAITLSVVARSRARSSPYIPRSRLPWVEF